MTFAAITALATSFIAWFFENHEHRAVYPFDHHLSHPAEIGEPRLSEARFTTQDGETLVLWQAKPQKGKPTILYFPGNAGALADRVGRFRAFLDRGYGLTALAYRGSSGSTGKPDEDHLTADAFALARTLPKDGLILYGESLGTALVIKLAAQGFGEALVLEAPFTSFPDLVAAQYPNEDILDRLTQIWDNRSHITSVNQPFLLLHGIDDRLVPFAQGQELFEAAPSTNKSMIALEGRGHRDTWSVEGQTALYQFLNAF